MVEPIIDRDGDESTEARGRSSSCLLSSNRNDYAGSRGGCTSGATATFKSRINQVSFDTGEVQTGLEEPVPLNSWGVVADVIHLMLL